MEPERRKTEATVKVLLAKRDEKFEAYHHHLTESHLFVQRVMVRAAAPIAGLLFLFQLFTDPCWQHGIRLASVIGAIALWFLGLHLTKKGKLEQAVLLFSFSVIGVAAVTMLVMHGTAASSMIANLAAIYYLSLFSIHYIVGAAGISALTFIVNNMAYHQGWYPMVELSSTDLLINEISMCGLILVVYVILVKRSREWNESLIELLTETNEYQSKIIQAANNVATTLASVVAEIVRVADLFAKQARALTDMANSTNTAMARGQKAVDETTAFVASTRTAVDTTREGSIAGKERLQKVKRGFENVVANNDNVKSDFAHLISLTENIGGVLRINQEISAQIKILAVNASIQAAKAGAHGAGFRVVAKELKEMIQSTEESLAVSQNLLNDIRECALKSTGTLQQSIDLLVEQFGELQSTSAFIEGIADEYLQTAEMVEGIAVGAYTQQELLNKVDSGMKRIGQMVADFDESSRQLLDCVNRISSSHQSLQNVFSDRDRISISGDQ